MVNYHTNRQSSNSIFVYHHMGLGDHFVCNGLVRSLLEKHSNGHLYISVKKHNYTTVRSMYIDDPRIICLPVFGDGDVPKLSQVANADVLYRSGFEKTRTDWDVSFYDSVGLPFFDRWDFFKINRNTDREESLFSSLDLGITPYIVVHDLSSVGRFDKMKVESAGRRIVKIEKLTDNMLDWCKVIERAEEFHGIDSSAIHLAQSLNVKKGVVHASTPTPPQINPNGKWSLQTY